MTFTLRLIEQADNAQVEHLCKDTLAEFSCVGPGYASNDPELTDMYGTYPGPDSRYWVIVDDAGAIHGGGGFSRLKGTPPEDGICELQKLYFRESLRGQGWGRRLMNHIIDAATTAGYQTLYLESVPRMTAAIRLYETSGFHHLDAHLGATGHHERCTVRMSRALGVAATV